MELRHLWMSFSSQSCLKNRDALACLDAGEDIGHTSLASSAYRMYPK